MCNTYTHLYANLSAVCVFIKKILFHFPLPSSAVLLFCNFSGVTANWCELGERFAASLPFPYNKLEPERGRGAGGKEKHGEKMEKREKTGGRLGGEMGWRGCNLPVRSHLQTRVSLDVPL